MNKKDGRMNKKRERQKKKNKKINLKNERTKYGLVCINVLKISLLKETMQSLKI